MYVTSTYVSQGYVCIKYLCQPRLCMQQVPMPAKVMYVASAYASEGYPCNNYLFCLGFYDLRIKVRSCSVIVAYCFVFRFIFDNYCSSAIKMLGKFEFSLPQYKNRRS